MPADRLAPAEPAVPSRAGQPYPTPPHPARSHPALRTFGPAVADWRVVCCPHAGGGAGFFRRLADVPDAPQVVAVQYPGRETRIGEPLARTMPELLSTILEPVAELLADDVPTVLLGHSLGASVAVEIARHARPDLLALSARAAPGAATEPRAPREEDALRDWLMALDGTPQIVLSEPEFLAMHLTVLRADLDVAESWEDDRLGGSAPEPPIDVPLLLLLGESDPAVPPADVLAWERLGTAGAQSRAFPGGHFYLTEHAEQVIGELRSALFA